MSLSVRLHIAMFIGSYLETYLGSCRLLAAVALHVLLYQFVSSLHNAVTVTSLV